MLLSACKCSCVLVTRNYCIGNEEEQNSSRGCHRKESWPSTASELHGRECANPPSQTGLWGPGGAHLSCGAITELLITEPQSGLVSRPPGSNLPAMGEISSTRPGCSVLRTLPCAAIQELLWQSQSHHLSWDRDPFVGGSSRETVGAPLVSLHSDSLIGQSRFPYCDPSFPRTEPQRSGSLKLFHLGAVIK